MWVAVTHGDVIKAVLADALGMHLDLFQRIVVDPCSVSVVRYTPLRPFVLRVNDSGGDLSGFAPRRKRSPAHRRAHGAGLLRRGRRGRRGLGVGSAHARVFEYDPPERFVAGTVGEPGARTFFLQARAGGRLTSVALEKAQVSALAERVGELLDEIVRRSGGQAPVPAIPAAGSEDAAPLDVPIDEEFRVGTMSLAWDGDRDVVVIECFEVSEDDVDPEVPRPDPRPRTCCACPWTARPRGRSPPGPWPWSPPAVRRARSAPGRWTPRVTSAPARTGTGAERRVRGRPRAGGPRPGWCRATMEVLGRLVGRVERHAVRGGGGRGGRRGERSRVRLQARRGGAAPVGLPRRDPRPARGRLVRGVGRDGLGRGAAHRLPRRSAGAGVGAAVVAAGRRGPVRAGGGGAALPGGGPHRHRRAAAGGGRAGARSWRPRTGRAGRWSLVHADDPRLRRIARPRRRPEQRRPQGRVTSCPAGRGGARGGPRPDLPRGTQAAHRAVGFRGQPPPRGGARGAGPAGGAT